MILFENHVKRDAGSRLEPQPAEAFSHIDERRSSARPIKVMCLLMFLILFDNDVKRDAGRIAPLPGILFLPCRSEEIKRAEGKLFMSNVVAFCFNGVNVRTLTKDAEVFFRASDVGLCLNLRGSDIVRNLDEDEVLKVHGVDSLGREKEVSYLSESGVYTILIRSNKEEAKPFRRWVTHEVLPSIRKEGFYVTEKLKAELAEKDIELARKEAVIKRLQKKKKQSRYLVPSSDHLEGFEPPLVSKPAEELTPEQIAKAKQIHVIKTLNGIITKHIIERTKQEKHDLMIALVSSLLE